ncbi:MAG TPA: tetratricopeptide repeat protein [Chitinivibrionales bacterium]|nr:tetratricopeptide repeat protein [Chitinivibrionales bacterium]
MKSKSSLLLLPGILVCMVSGASADNAQSARDIYQQGLEKLNEHKRAEAYEYFNQACKKDPANPQYSWAAATSADNREDAFTHAEDAWAKGFKRPEALFFRTALSFHGNREEALSFALKAFADLPDSFRTAELRGDIFFRFEQFDSALAKWKPLNALTPSARLYRQIALAHSGKGDFEKARAVLTEARGKNMLDRTGMSALATLDAYSFDYAAVDSLFKFMQVLGLFNDTSRVEYADLLVAQERYGEAVKLLSGVHNTLLAKGAVDLAFRIRAVMYLIYYTENQPDGIRRIEAIIPRDFPFFNAEKAFAGALTGAARDSAGALPLMEVNRKALPACPAIDLIVARENGKRGNYEKSAAGLGSLPPIFSHSPRVLVERATAYADAGADSAALALIAVLHDRKWFTKQSLELFRDIMFRKNMADKGMAAQALLEKQFPRDPGVLYKKGMLALAAGKTDSAFGVFAALSKEYPENEGFEIAMLSTLLSQRKYDAVLAACGNSSVSPQALASFQARALHFGGNPREARAVYEKLLNRNKSRDLLAAYSSFLIETAQFGAAASVFKDLIAACKKDGGTRDKELGLLYNNLAWSYLKADSCPPAELLIAAKRAYALASDNPHVLDTYAEALLKTGRHDECIRLLKDHPLAVREPQLLFLLGTAFEKNNQKYEAGQSFASAVSAVRAGRQQVPVTFDTSEISERVKFLESSR